MTNIDHDAVARVIGRYRVRFAVLFGSHARGTQTASSDIDIAIEFEECVPASERAAARIDIIVDLTEVFETDDIDVTDLDGVRPEIGLSAIENGIVLIGSAERKAALRERFEAESNVSTHDERMEEFDALLSRLDGFV